MAQQLLKDSLIFPDEKVLENILWNKYFLYQRLVQQTPELEYGWKYYNDGKAWLCKISNSKKKTIFWLSVWEWYFKVSFYFTEKTRWGVLNLPIDEKLKEVFLNTSPTGKLVPLIIDVFEEKQLSYLIKIVEYKKGLK